MRRKNLITDIFSNYASECRKRYFHYERINSWNENDVRLTSFAKIATCIDNARIGYILGKKTLGYELSKQKFGERILTKAGLSKYDKEFVVQNYMIGIQRSFLLALFQSIESSIRIMAKSIRCHQYGDFAQTYKNVINRTSFISTDKGNYIALLDILRIMRNSIHTNGLYDPTPNSSGVQRSFSKVYDTKTYTYNPGDAIIIGWGDLQTFTVGIINLLNDLMKDPIIIGQPVSQMVDPSH